jgi:diguanylate cyclase (GGDEF)-like protein/PAS domain S-box-containing protein
MSEIPGASGGPRAASLQLLLGVMEALPDALVISDRDGLIIAANPAAEEMFGYARGELDGQPVEVLVPERFRERHPERRAEYYERINQRRLGLRADVCAVRRDGSEFPVDLTLNVLRTSDGFVVLSGVHDLSERLGLSQALRASEERYRNIFERNSAVKIIVDPGTGAIVDANSAACAFYGYTHAELTSMTVFDLNTTPRERVLEELARAVGEEENYFQFRHRLASGEVRDIEIYAGPFDAGERRLVCSIVHDISARKQSEALLESHRQLLEMIAAGARLEDVLDRLVLTFEEHAPGALCSVLMLDAGGTHLSHASAPSLPEAYNRAVNGIEIGPQAGSCGTAAYRREPVVVTDIEHDPLWANARDVALAHGLRSCWSTPIVATVGEVLGTFAVYYREPREPRDQDRVLIEMATHVAGVAIARQRSEQALLSRNAELEDLYGQLVRAHGDLAESKERLEEKSALLEQALEAERARGRIDTLTGTLNHAAITEELRRAIADADTGTVGVAMVDVDGLKVANDTYGHQTGDEVLVTVADALRRDGVLVGRYGGDEFVAILPGADRVAAEGYRDEVLASLAGAGLADPQTGAQVPIVASMGLAIYPHEAEAVDDLIRLSDSAMYASRRQRSMDDGGTLPRTLGGERAAKMVGEIVPLLTSPGDLAGKLRLVAHRITVGAGYDGVTFILKGTNETKGTTSAFMRLPDEEIDRWNQTLGTQLSGEIVDVLRRTGRPVIIDDPEHDERLVRTTRAMLAFAGIKSALIAPMLWEGELIGALSVGSKRESAFSVRDAEFVAAVATQVAAIVRMAAFVEELQTSSSQLMRAHTETVLMLAGAAEAHDHTTGRHLQRVSELAGALARELGHDEAAARDLALAAVLHDIGKIRVPDMVLGSSSKLAESEWVLMRQHTIWGSEFLAGQQGFGLAASVARSHHERWDGDGYPSGLRGDEIPEAAQITSVADAFDAMTNDRPYRLGRPTAEAIGEIVACSGTQFSPRVVAALVRLWENGALPFFEQDEHEVKAA